jgi:hypothetical protein
MRIGGLGSARLMLPKRARPAPAARAASTEEWSEDGSAISVSLLKLQLNPASCTVTGAASFLALTSSLNQQLPRPRGMA